ncbi:MAG: 23S rRNA (pseudouridine(1915)-N(3))-methyltransferase RlmH [Oligoflexia bacterium]|nr:23S rRNA (pseudouridine(1915)-N(3))-methyltransferase RlmH [Oligoflexia bacterium]
MKVIFLTTTNKFPPWLDQLSEEYAKKISFWLPVELRNLATKNFSRQDKEHKLKAEEESFINFFKADDFVLLCDESGKNFNSIEFSKKIENILSTSKKRLLIVIGGAFGVGTQVKQRADMVLSLSNFVLNHHLALGVAVEQVYRAVTILKNVKYHNQ